MFIEVQGILKKVRSRAIGVLMVFAIICTMMPVTVFAADNKSTPTRTEMLDVSTLTQTTDMLNTEGWKWVPTDDGGTLTLRNYYSQTKAAKSLHFPSGNVTIMLEGENTIETTSTVFNPMIDGDTSNNVAALNLTIAAGTKDGKLNILRKDALSSTAPYAIAGNTVSIQSGDIYTNTEFCIIKNSFTMQGGSLKIDVANIGIYSVEGNINISGGNLDINAGLAGIFIPGNTNIGGQKVSFTGGDVKVQSGFVAIHAKNITVNTDGALYFQGNEASLYCSKEGGVLEILSAGSLTLAGKNPYLPIVTSGGKTVTIGSANYTKVDKLMVQANALNPEHFITSLADVQTAVSTVTQGKSVLEQNTVNSYATAIEVAIQALKYKDADYTKVDEALAKIPPDSSIYTDGSVKALNDAKSAVIRGKNITEQKIVDGYATAIEATFQALKYKDANYTKVDEAIAKTPSDSSIYTDGSVKALNDAKSAVIRGKNITEQKIVDGYATAIEATFQALKFKEADYTKVDEAITKIPIDSSIYTDGSVKALNDAKSAVIRGKNITEQKIVDGYATAIEATFQALKFKDADYTKVDEALAKIPSDSSIYTDVSFKALNDAKSAVIRGKNITEQKIVDSYAIAIENAMKNLEKKLIISITDPETSAKIEYEDGSPFDDGITLSVTTKSETEMNKFTDAINKVLPGMSLGGLYDISLLKDGVTIQPDGKVKVSITLFDELKAMSDLQVVYIDDNGNVTVIPSEIKDGKISFVTDHFSYYGIVGKTKVKAPASPVTGDNTSIIFYSFIVFLSASSLFMIEKNRKAKKQ